MTSVDKMGMIVAVAVVIIFVGLGVGMSNVSEDTARPNVEQQKAVPITDDLMKPKVEPGIPVGTGSSGSSGTTEICGDGIDNDGDGRIDEAPPPSPGVNWDRCDVSGDDYTGENLRGASMIMITAVETVFNDANLSNVNARGGDFSYSEIKNARMINADFRNTVLTHTMFNDSMMQGTNLSDAELSDATFRSADVSNVNFNQITFATDRMHGVDADYTGASFNNIDGLQAWFYSPGLAITSFADATFFATTTDKIRLHGSSIESADFRGAIVSTGIFEDDESYSEHWWYDADTSLDCINHVICNDVPLTLFADIRQVEPEPGKFRDVKINYFESWYGGHVGDSEDYWNCYDTPTATCYFPQVATIVAGGTVNWIYDKDDRPAGADPIRKIIIEPESELSRSFTSPDILPGEEWSHTFKMPGKYHYFDAYNPEWVGQVIVFGKTGSGDSDVPPDVPPENPPNNPPKDPKENPKSDGLKKESIPAVKSMTPPMKPMTPPEPTDVDPGSNCWNLDEFGNKFYDPAGIPAPPSPGVDWDYCILDGHDYSGENLSNATIRFGSTVGTDFSNTLLNNAQFGKPSGIPPTEIDVTDSTDAIFTDANGKDTQFQGVTLNGANFDNAKMPRVLFDGAGMIDVSMRDAYMPEASLKFANVIHSDLQNANLKYSDMTHVNLESTNLSNAMLAQVIFDEGLLVDAWFTNAHMNDSTLRNVDGSAGEESRDRISKFNGASMNNVIICNSNFNDATFEDADLTNSVFNDCDSGDEISFLGTNLHNAEFMGVFIPAVGPTSFPSMIDGTSPISDELTDKSCLHHPYCDLEPIPGGTFVPDTSDSTSTETDGASFYEVDGELLPIADGDIVQVIRFTEGSGAPGCESTEDGCYLPSTLVKEIGLSVLWVNDDISPHTVTSGSPADGPDGIFDSSLMASGDSFEFPFEEEGTFDYFCMVHPWMTGTVIILPEIP